MVEWEKIRAEHGEMVWSVIARILRNREDIADCYQDVFFEAFRRTNRRPAENIGGLLRWLAVRRALDHLRKCYAGVRCIASDEIALLVEAARADLGLRNELLDAVRLELTRLPALQADAFWMCCIEEFSYGETAVALGIDASYVGTLVYRARRHLRRRLDATGAQIKP